MEHTNPIAVAILKKEYSDYPQNDWHYDREYKMMCEAIEKSSEVPTKEQKEEYYIQNTNQGYLGNAIVFWAKNSRGYTADLNNSHKFTYEEAKKICTNNPEKNKAWPVSYIDGNSGNQTVTDCQYLDSSQIKIFKD